MQQRQVERRGVHKRYDAQHSLRLSVEWSRIEPERGLFDQTALRKYAEMIGLLRDPEMAAIRMRRVLAVAGIE